MIQWIGENAGTIIVSIALFTLVTGIVIRMCKDKKQGKYNPFLAMGTGEDPQRWKQYLVLAMARCTDFFERLPLVQDKDILDNILYKGVWMRLRKARGGNHA